MLQKLALSLLAVAVIAGLIVYLAGSGRFGSVDRGEITRSPRAAQSVTAAVKAQQRGAAGIGAPVASGQGKQILFGDLHVHTTISLDAFMMSLPVLQGEGAHPPADACNFARYCSALDFWSINDHAEAITPAAWRQTVASIRECNAVASDPANPDTVAFLGWEWTQVGPTPDTHYGHKNVVLRDLADDRIPARPIAATGTARQVATQLPGTFSLGMLALASGQERYYDFATYLKDRIGFDECPAGVDTKELSPDCQELAETPAELFRKLDEWGLESIVIPHGTTWGMYTPTGSTWDKQLSRKYHDPKRQTLIEVYSGHGSAEQYSDYRGVLFDAEGKAYCPEEQPHYQPACQRAGQIIRERCLAEGSGVAECDQREIEARQIAAEALGQAHLTVPGTRPEEWLDAGLCRECSEPAFNHRPGGSAQYVMALSNFDEEGEEPGHPLRFRFGFMASSDNHYARPGTGYKEVARIGMTESRDRNLPETEVTSLFRPELEAPQSKPRIFDRSNSDIKGFQLFEMERLGSFFLTGGLIAAHAEGRDRNSIWGAMKRREVYGTTGLHTLLWFDLLNPPGSRGRGVAMGGEVEMRDVPIFQVRAVGSFVQEPGCPDYASSSLSSGELERLCRGECYNPTDTRRVITRLEVIRIRPQSRPGEAIAPLIADPWQVFECDGDPAGCAFTFSDPDYPSAARDTLYYVRAIEEPALGVNAGGLRCQRDEAGRCTSVDLCGTDPESDPDCLSEFEPRAWSSPIFVDWPAESS